MYEILDRILERKYEIAGIIGLGMIGAGVLIGFYYYLTRPSKECICKNLYKEQKDLETLTKEA